MTKKPKKAGPPDASIWFRVIIGDHAKETAFLDTTAVGALLLLKMAYWPHDYLPNHAPTLAMIARLSPSHWEIVAPGILPMFVVEGDRLRHPRWDVEKAEARELSVARSKAGRSGARKRYGQDRPQPDSKRDGKGIANGMANTIANASQIDRQSQAAAPAPSPSEPTSTAQQQQQHAAAGLRDEAERVLRLYAKYEAEIFGTAVRDQFDDADWEAAAEIAAYQLDPHYELRPAFCRTLENKKTRNGKRPTHFRYVKSAVDDVVAERERINSQPLIARH